MWKPRFPAIAVAMATAIACALPIATGLAPLRAAAAGELSLVRASSVLMIDTLRVTDSAAAADTNASQAMYLQLLVKNLAYEKAVTLMIKNDSAWDSIPFRWVRQADDDYEYWDLHTSMGITRNQQAPHDVEFKVRYLVNKTTYWDDNHGNNYKLAKNGGTLLPAGAVFFKSCRWERDTGANADTSVFTGEAEVRGWKAGASLTIAYSADNLQTQGFYTAKADPEPTWLGAAPADSDQVRLYRFRATGIKLPYSVLPVLNFHLKYWDGAKDWRDDNRGNRYAIMLGSKLQEMYYEELPQATAMGRRADRRVKAMRAVRAAQATPVFGAAARGFFDGIGRRR